MIPSTRSRFSIYCDESCHLEKDRQSAMVLGGIWCPSDQTAAIFRAVREIKTRHGFSSQFEIKWTKVSPSSKGMAFYADLVRFFLDDGRLRFRGLLIPDKSKLRHDAFSQDHDTFYYKMYFLLLQRIFRANASFRIYIDIKDSRSSTKVQNLTRILRSKLGDHAGESVICIQQVRSHEVELLQLADLIIGAIGYLNRGLSVGPTVNAGKAAVINQLRDATGQGLDKSSMMGDEKFNLFRWTATGED